MIAWLLVCLLVSVWVLIFAVFNLDLPIKRGLKDMRAEVEKIHNELKVLRGDV
jgi:hypothetical protein